MKIIYSQKAQKNLRKIPKNKQVKILKQIESLEKYPFSGKKLKGRFVTLLSLKIWPYRTIYQVIKKNKTILIVTIEHRQKSYK